MLSRDEARDMEEQQQREAHRAVQYSENRRPTDVLRGTNPKDLVGITKPPLHLVPPALRLFVSQVFKFSAYLRKPKPYGPYNWRENKVVKSIYIDAIGRHLDNITDGQWIDSETKLPHVAHIAANCAILLDAERLGNLVDDMKWPAGPAPQIIAEMTEKKEGA